jgi:hypothetical protein
VPIHIELSFAVITSEAIARHGYSPVLVDPDAVVRDVDGLANRRRRPERSLADVEQTRRSREA